MKTFAFPLDRVLDWRRTQLRLEEMKVGQIHSELHAVDTRQAALIQERAAANLLPRVGGIMGPEFAALDQFRKHLSSERTRLAEKRKAIEIRLAAQIDTLSVKRRDVLLLEKIRQRRWEEWNRQQANEVEMQAGETALCRWSRVQ